MQKIPHTQIRKQTKATDILEYAARTKWKWAGHVSRMNENRWTQRVNDWCPYDRTRRTGRPNTRWRDDIVKYETMGWQRDAHDRHYWKYREEGFIRQWMI